MDFKCAIDGFLPFGGGDAKIKCDQGSRRPSKREEYYGPEYEQWKAFWEKDRLPEVAFTLQCHACHGEQDRAVRNARLAQRAILSGLQEAMRLEAPLTSASGSEARGPADSSTPATGETQGASAPSTMCARPDMSEAAQLLALGVDDVDVPSGRVPAPSSGA